MQARSAVQCRSARLSEAVSPAKSARVAIGLIVVKRVAKSLLILIKSGDICRSVSFYPDTNDVSSASKVVALSIAVFRFNALTIQRFNEAL